MKSTYSKIPFKCPYNEFSCDVVNTASCKNCPHYHNAVKATGSMPVFNWIYQQIKRIPKTDYDRMFDAILIAIIAFAFGCLIYNIFTQITLIKNIL